MTQQPPVPWLAGIRAGATGAFRRIGAFLGGVTNALLGLATVLLLAFVVFLLGVATLVPVDPVVSDRVVSVDPEDRYLDRNLTRNMRIVREVCSSREQFVEVVRAWAEYSAAEEPHSIRAFASVWVTMPKGCRLVRIDLPVPQTLPPGVYIYEVSIRACLSIVFHRCSARPLVPVPVTLVGGRLWPDVDAPKPPPIPGPAPPEGGSSWKGGL